VDKVVETGTNDEGPLYVCPNSSVVLEAKPAPPTDAPWMWVPRDCSIAWSIESKPDGSNPSLTPNPDYPYDRPDKARLSNLDKVGDYVVKAASSCDGHGDTITVTAIEVASLLPDAGTEIDDGDGDPNTKSFVVCIVEPNDDPNIVTVTATPNPSVSEEDLPDCWALAGGDGNSLLFRTVDRTTTGETTITCVCGPSSKTTKIYVVKVRIIEPDENPVTDNNFTFNGANPGVCNVTGTGTTGVPDMDPNLQWSISGISGSTLTSEPPDRKGPDITFTYTGLPSSWVAWKNLYLTHPAVSCMDYQLVEIFFLRDEYNNPEGINPNWYYYWSKTGASSGTHDYNETIPWDGCYTDGDNFFEIGPSAKDQDGGLVVKGDGIDNFGSTCLHEKAHMDYYFSAWDPYNPNQDQDGDGLKDTDEPGLIGLNGQPYNPNNWDTNNDRYEDGEDYACKFENTWEEGSHDYEDWANPGHRSNK
jgi:hypothetical protein